jgi:nitroreductase
MDFKELAESRYSCRKYQTRAVEDEKIQRILETVRLAPTAANRQPFRLVVITDPEVRRDMKAVYDRSWFYGAPAIVVAVGMPGENWVRRDGKNYNDVDVAIAMDYMTLQAADLGLGTCWIADFDPDAARDVLNLPEDAEPILMTPLGYPADAAGPKRRKQLSKLVIWDRFSDE